MKTYSTRSVFVASLTLAAVSVQAAKEYKGVCIFDEPECSGTIKLREYTPDNCVEGMCGALEGDDLSMFSAMATCTEDYMAETASHLAGLSYVVVENYEGTGCEGDFTNAIAVATDGKCYPGTDGMYSYMATMKEDKSVSFMKYMNGTCGSDPEEMMFKSSEVDHSMCVGDNMKVSAHMEEGDMDDTTMDGSMKMSDSDMMDDDDSGAMATVAATFAPMVLAVAVALAH